MNDTRTLHIVRIVLCALCFLVSSNLKLNAADDVTIEVRFNGEGEGSVLHILKGSVGENSISIPTDGLDVGANLMTVRVLDSNGNVSTSYSRVIYLIGEKATEADNATIEVLFNGKDLHTLNGIVGENKIILPTDNLDIGPNLMTIRVKDAKGNLSTSYTRVLYVTEGETVSAAEYYIDSDPGKGKGSPIAVNGKPLLEFSVQTSELSIGMHTLYARVCSSDGTWSAPQSKTFMVTRNGVTLEWFLDEDPGIGNGNLVEAEVGDNVVPISLSGVEPGAHLISFRCRTSNNKQSVTTSRLVYVTPKLTVLEAEYFVDDDPGEANATPLSIGQDGVMPITIETNSLATGSHTLTVRVKVAEDTWLPIYANVFVITEETGVSSLEMMKDMSISRKNNSLTLASHHVENGSSVRILTIDGIEHYRAVWENTEQPLVANLPTTLKNLIVVVETKNGKRLVKLIR